MDVLGEKKEWGVCCGLDQKSWFSWCASQKKGRKCLLWWRDMTVCLWVQIRWRCRSWRIGVLKKAKKQCFRLNRSTDVEDVCKRSACVIVELLWGANISRIKRMNIRMYSKQGCGNSSERCVVRWAASLADGCASTACVLSEFHDWIHVTGCS